MAIAPGKEGGVNFLKINDSSTPELNVSEIYVRDFSRGKRIFVTADGKTASNVQLNFKQENRAEISDHLTKFCAAPLNERGKKTQAESAEMSANQARRVQALLTQQSLAPIYEMQARGSFGASPKSVATNEKGIMHGSSDSAFKIEQLKGGNVEVTIMQRLRPFGFQYIDDNNKNQQVKLDRKTSFIQTDLKFLVPRKKSGAPIMRQFIYRSHIADID